MRFPAPASICLCSAVCAAVCLCAPTCACASIFSQLHGVVHDPQHRPVAGATVELHAANSALVKIVTTGQDGSFSFASVPLGDYTLRVTARGFAPSQQAVTLASDTAPILHLQLVVATDYETVTVRSDKEVANVNSVTPTTLVGRVDIAETPGADRTNSMAMITDYVPGAYMTHDMLHMRGGHQIDWQIDGVEIPNTNIASNLAAQIDPKDIDYLEVQRGSYTSDIGDRTYGVFNIVPRSGFERDRQGELVLSAGNFNQTNDQINFGDHTRKFAYYVSASGNRSDYGLAPPIARVYHDADSGFGGFASLILNRDPSNQFRLVSMAREDFFQIPYDPDPNDFENQQYDSSGLRDVQHETDVADAFTWLHTFNSSTVLQISPLYHLNKVDYDANPGDQPVATTYHRSSNYAGAQFTLDTEIARNNLQAGLYSFYQQDENLFGALFNDGSFNNFSNTASAKGGVVEESVSDNWKATSWLTVIAGLRASQFRSSFGEDEIDPRLGLAIRIPKLNWVFRGFYGRFYQPPPLLTVQCGTSNTAGTTPANCAVESYALTAGTSFAPLHGERDEEHQFGVQIPFRGWLLDADTFKTRAANFLDHSNIGESSIYFPVTDQGALIQAWELTLRSPRLWHFGQAHLAYSNQIAQQIGAVTGGLVCAGASANPGDPCFIAPGYSPLDHDQRDTLDVGFNASLPRGMYASMNFAFGSGFHNGDPDPATPYPNAYLPFNTSFDLAAGKTFHEKVTLSVTAVNVANRRTLLDNSLTFGGFHFNDPRQIYGELKYRFHF